MPVKIKVKFADVPDSQNFGPMPLGRYPALMHIDAYQHDASGTYATDGNGDKVYWTTTAGDPKWNVEMEILDLKYAGKKILENFSFGPGGLKRMKHIYVRGGFVDENVETELTPEDLDKTYWNIDVKHDVAMDTDGKTPKASKYTFKANGCGCKTCTTYDGKDVMVNTKVEYAGFYPMDPKEAKRYAAPVASAGTSGDGICGECKKGVHHHKFEKDNCKCQVEDHPAF